MAAAVVQPSMERWFTPESRQQRPDVIARTSKSVLANDPTVQAALWDLIAGLDTREQLTSLRCPTLVIVGEEDPSTPPAAAHAIGEQVPGAQVEIIPGASHMVTLEVPEAVNGLLRSFLSRA